MTTTMPRSLRADAQDNRDRVVEAARGLFTEGGLGVPVAAIARRAGVAPATLYRRFPTKQALVRAVFADQLHACRAIVLAASADPDAWRAFRGVVERTLVLNAMSRRFTDAFFAAEPDAFDLAAHRAEMLDGIAPIARRAVADGRLRPDFVVDDLVLVLLAGRGIATASTEDRVAAARRFAALVIDGFRSAATNRPLPAGPRPRRG